MTARLNPTAGSLLGFLGWAPMTGWDLVRTADQVVGPFWSLTPSQVYRELQRLQAEGLVEAGEPGPRERVPFTRTAAGSEAFQQWLDQGPGEEQIRFPLLVHLLFGADGHNNRLADSLSEQRRNHAERLERYRTQHAQALTAGDASAWALAPLEFGLRYEQMVLDWFDALTLPLP